MEIRCPSCQDVFEADSQQKKLVNAVLEKNQRLVFVECPKCYKDVPINPKDLLSREPQKDESKKDKSFEQIKCPICHEGLVCHVANKDGEFWGCGECGNVWYSKSELDKAFKSSLNQRQVNING